MNKTEHIEKTLARYGIKAEDIHSFMDEPVRAFGCNHRTFRHNEEAIKLVGNLFGAKYGIEIAESIALDHIMADHEQGIKRRATVRIIKEAPQEYKVVNMKCEECGKEFELGKKDYFLRKAIGACSRTFPMLDGIAKTSENLCNECYKHRFKPVAQSLAETL